MFSWRNNKNSYLDTPHSRAPYLFLIIDKDLSTHHPVFIVFLEAALNQDDASIKFFELDYYCFDIEAKPENDLKYFEMEYIWSI